jgi:hypothetical protein
MCNEVIADSILNKLEGTIIADLKSLVACAEKFNKKTKSDSSFGGLNFTLFLVSLIACETFGYFLDGAKLHKNVSENEHIDTGQYTMDFIQQYFERDSYFKKLKKVLANWLRNYLVHGFGSLDVHDNYDISLFISKDIIQVAVGKEGEKKIIKLNSIAVARQTIIAFLKMKKIVQERSNVSIINSIAEAVANKRKLSGKVLNEFNAVYKIAERKGLTF